MWAIDDASAEVVGSVVEGITVLVLAGGGLWTVTRLILSAQLRLLQATTARNKTLEERVTQLENEKRQEQDEHFNCRAELNQHKIESAREIAALKAQVEMLTQQVNRRHRHDDPDEEGEEGT